MPRKFGMRNFSLPTENREKKKVRKETFPTLIENADGFLAWRETEEGGMEGGEASKGAGRREK
jgi:hypothetical protein